MLGFLSKTLCKNSKNNPIKEYRHPLFADNKKKRTELSQIMQCIEHLLHTAANVFQPAQSLKPLVNTGRIYSQLFLSGLKLKAALLHEIVNLGNLVDVGRDVKPRRIVHRYAARRVGRSDTTAAPAACSSLLNIIADGDSYGAASVASARVAEGAEAIIVILTDAISWCATVPQEARMRRCFWPEAMTLVNRERSPAGA